VAHLITLAFAASVFLVTVFLVWELWLHSAIAAQVRVFVLTGTDWDPYGTVVTSVAAMIVAIPLSVGAAERDLRTARDVQPGFFRSFKDPRSAWAIWPPA